MPGNPLLGKFGPIILVAVVQLVLILAAPSTGTATTAAGAPTPYATTGLPGTTAGQSGGSTGVTGAGTTGPAAAAAAAPGAGGPLGSAAAGSAATAGGSTAGAAAGAAQPGSTGGPVTASGAALQKLPGDRTHCVGGRQFSAAIDFYAPPCVPGKPGAAFANNGGATWQGVTGNTVEIVNYVADYGAEVDQILKEQNNFYNASDAKVWNKAYEDFINTHYQLWGRKLHIDTVQGNCRTIPPDVPCLIGDMDRVVQTYHPYAVFWETTICSACFAELSRLHVVNFGGYGFSDAFHNQNAPYSYDAEESASRVELQFADWWCHQMNGRPAIFAGKENPAQNLRVKTRVLGVFSTNDPDNKNTVQQVLKPALQQGCGATINHEYYYAQDINTATQQSQAAEAAMNTPTNPATTVLCLCDPVAPQFGFNAFATDNYWPEVVLGTDQLMDFDSNGQTYSSKDHSKDQLSCPKPNQGCGFDNAIGLSTDVPQKNPNELTPVRIYEMSSGQHTLPHDGQPPSLQVVWDDYSMLASLLQNAGPLLTPQRMQQAAPQMGMVGGGTTGMPLRGFRNNDWCWTQDVRVVYWDANRVSPYDGAHGTFVQIEGRRFDVGQFPTMSQPPAPAPENRT